MMAPACNMEEKASDGKLVPRPPSPPLLFLLIQDYKKMVFSSIGDEKNRYHVETAPRELYDQEIQAYAHGWFILLDNENQHNWVWNMLYQERRYSLWNPLTLEWIHLRPLTLKAKQEISFCILSSPPDNPNSMLILFETKVPSLIFLRIGIGYKQWTHQTIKLKLDGYDFLHNPVICNTTLYCQTFSRPKLVKIELNMPDYCLPLTLFDESISAFPAQSMMACKYMLESCGELFAIYLVRERPFSQQEVISVEVFRLDFLAMVWIKVESIQNRAFFVSETSSFSWPASSVSKIRGNHVYFTLPENKCLHSFNMNNKSLSVSLVCPNFPFSWCPCSPVCIMPDTRLIEQVREIDKLPLDMLFAIGKCLKPHDYMNFRSVNTRLRSAAPPIQWKSATLEGLKGYNSLPPWLMLHRRGDSTCSFINLWDEQCLMDIPNNQLKNVKRAYSREGWCLMLEEKHSIYLWNPFVKKTIQLPDPPHKDFTTSCVSFSTSIDWVVLICHCPRSFFIDYIFLEEGEWHGLCADKLFQILSADILTFYGGAFYTLGWEGQLIAIEETGVKIFAELKRPCSSFERSYLVECDGELLAVFVGFLGKRVRIFMLNEPDVIWEEVENLGSNTIYVSHYSSFAIPATEGMDNRVYFPGFYGKNAVYYSLSSRKFHVHGTNKVLNRLDYTEEFYYSWIQPKW